LLLKNNGIQVQVVGLWDREGIASISKSISGVRSDDDDRNKRINPDLNVVEIGGKGNR